MTSKISPRLLDESAAPRVTEILLAENLSLPLPWMQWAAGNMGKQINEF